MRGHETNYRHHDGGDPENDCDGQHCCGVSFICGEVGQPHTRKRRAIDPPGTNCKGELFFRALRQRREKADALVCAGCGAEHLRTALLGR